MGLKCLNGKRLLHSLVIAMCLLPLCTFAQSIDSYCLTRSSNSKVPDFKAIGHSKNLPLQVAFTVKGQNFRIIAKTPQSNYFGLLDSNNNLLAKEWASQAEQGEIQDLILGENSWLWIDGDRKDYVIQIDQSQIPPKFGELQNIPELYPERHSYLWRWLDGYSYTQGDFSRNLNRVFVSGYPLSWLGVSLFGWPPLVSYEVVDGKSKLLPALLQGATLVGQPRFHQGMPIYEDFPNLKGVLFKGISGDALFYDGEKVTSLLDNYRNKDGSFPKWYSHFLPSSKRALIEISSDNIHTVFDLAVDHSLTKRLVIPDEIIGGNSFMFSQFFIFPEDQRFFVISSNTNSILTEVDGILRTGLTIKKPWFTGEIINSDTNNVLRFTVFKHKQFGLPTDIETREYSLSPASSNTQCLGYFNVDYPFELVVK
jgi:hypothetical protein